MVRHPRNGMRVMATSGFAATNTNCFVGVRGTIVAVYSNDPTGADYKQPVIAVRMDSRASWDEPAMFTCKQLTSANTPKFAKNSVRAKSVGENIERSVAK